MEKAHTKSRQQLKLYFSYLFFTSKTTLSVLSVHPRLRGQKVGEGTATHIGEPPKPAVLRLQTRAVTSCHELSALSNHTCWAPCGP